MRTVYGFGWWFVWIWIKSVLIRHVLLLCPFFKHWSWRPSLIFSHFLWGHFNVMARDNGKGSIWLWIVKWIDLFEVLKHSHDSKSVEQIPPRSFFHSSRALSSVRSDLCQVLFFWFSLLFCLFWSRQCNLYAPAGQMNAFQVLCCNVYTQGSPLQAFEYPALALLHVLWLLAMRECILCCVSCLLSSLCMWLMLAQVGSIWTTRFIWQHCENYDFLALMQSSFI